MKRKIDNSAVDNNFLIYVTFNLFTFYNYVIWQIRRMVEIEKTKHSKNYITYMKATLKNYFST